MLKNTTTYELYSHAGEIPLRDWYARGVKVLVLDKDGTLAPHDSNWFDHHVTDGLKTNGIRELFPEHTALVSNNSDSEHIKFTGEHLSRELGIKVFTVCQADGYGKKPSAEMGYRVAEHFGVNPDELGVVGDRYLTDVVFGRSLGARAIALCDRIGENDALLVPQLRVLEKLIVNTEQRLGFATR